MIHQTQTIMSCADDAHAAHSDRLQYPALRRLPAAPHAPDPRDTRTHSRNDTQKDQIMTMQRPEPHTGILKAWDSVNWLATVQLTGSLTLWLKQVPTSRGIPSAEMVVGRRVAALLFDPTNPADAVVTAVW